MVRRVAVSLVFLFAAQATAQEQVASYEGKLKDFAKCLPTEFSELEDAGISVSHRYAMCS